MPEIQSKTYLMWGFLYRKENHFDVFASGTGVKNCGLIVLIVTELIEFPIPVHVRKLLELFLRFGLM